MRRISVIVAVLASVAPAEAKYDACRSYGTPWLVPSGVVPRNFKLWRTDSSELLSTRLRVRGSGRDEIFDRERPEFRRTAIDLGVLGATQTYQVTLPAYRDLSLGSFTTSTDVDLVPPRAPVFRALAISHPSDPGHAAADDDPVDDRAPTWEQTWDEPANDFVFDLELSGDTTFVDLEITDETTVHRVHLWREDLPLLGRTRCGAMFHLAAGARVCVSVRAIDLAGNVGAPATRCTTVVDIPADSRREARPLADFPWPPEATPRDAPPWWGWFGLLAVFAWWVASRMAARSPTGVMLAP